MRPKHQFRPRLEALEARWVPATVQVAGGTLLISNQVGALTVSTTTGPAGSIMVSDGAKTSTVTGVSTGINITGTNAADTINFVGTAGTFPGNVLISSGNGNDTINLNGTIGGNLTLLGGLGDDGVKLAGNATVGGTLQLSDTSGKNTFDVNGNTFTVGGDTTLTGLASFTSGAGTIAAGGSLNLSALPGSSQAIDVELTGTAVTVGKSLNVTGYGGADILNVATTTLNVTGNTSVNLSSGLNTVTLDPAAGSVLNGSFTYNGWTGASAAAGVTLGDNLTLGGTATLTLTTPGMSFLTSTAVINGNLTVTSTNGDNTILFDTAGVLNGNVFLNLGNGTNSTTFNTTVSGKLTYRGGNGDNTLDLEGAGLYFVDITFGTFGTQQLTLGANGFITGRAFSGTPATSTFTNNGTTVDPFTINF